MSRALSVLQPWAALIVAGHKDIENRSWSTTYRGPILIHAGVRRDEEAFAMGLASGVIAGVAADVDGVAEKIAPHVRHGGIVGVADLVDVVRHHHSRWAVGNAWHWVLTNARPLPFAPCRGQLGLFEVAHV
jgi:hypothetical protein